MGALIGKGALIFKEMRLLALAKLVNALKPPSCI